MTEAVNHLAGHSGLYVDGLATLTPEQLDEQITFLHQQWQNQPDGQVKFGMSRLLSSAMNYRSDHVNDGPPR